MKTSNGYVPAKLLGLLLKPSNTIQLDPMLKEIGDPLRRLLKDMGVGRVVITGNSNGNPIFGRSWEMAAAMASQGHTGSYTGTVSSYDGNTVSFGAVPDVDVKDDLDKDLISYDMIGSMVISPNY